MTTRYQTRSQTKGSSPSAPLNEPGHLDDTSTDEDDRYSEVSGTANAEIDCAVQEGRNGSNGNRSTDHLPPIRDDVTIGLREKGHILLIRVMDWASPFLKVALFVVGIALTVSILKHKLTPVDQEQLSLKTFDKSFSTLSQGFKAQSVHTTTSLRIALRRTLKTPEPRDPSSVIVLIPPTLAEPSFPVCYLKVYGQLLNDRFKVPDAEALSVKTMDSQDIKSVSRTALHKELTNYFHNGGAVVVVSGIEEVRHYENLTLFHTFSDTTHAPVKKAVFFFLVNVPDALYEDVRVMEETDVELKLTNLGNRIFENTWSDLPDGKTHALLSRIGSWGTIMLNDGDKCQE